METFILENGWTIALAVIVATFFAVVSYAAWHSRDAASFNYPFDDPAFIHVGMTPVQQNEVGKIPAIRLTAFPFHRSLSDDSIFYAMTETEFLKFYTELAKYTRVLIADAALKQETFLRCPAATLSEMMIGLDSIKRRLLPTPTIVEFHPRHL